MCVWVCLFSGRAIQPAAVGEEATGTREEAETTGGGPGQAGWAGGVAPHSDSGSKGGQIHNLIQFKTNDAFCVFEFYLVSSPSKLPLSECNSDVLCHKLGSYLHVKRVFVYHFLVLRKILLDNVSPLNLH